MSSTEQLSFTLYHFKRCPFCIYVFDFLEKNEIEIPLKDILENQDFMDELIEGGGRRTVPCLRIDSPDGIHWMYESRDIVRFLKNHFIGD